MIEYESFFLWNMSLDCISLEQKSCQYLSRICIMRERNLKSWHYGRGHWRIGGDNRIRTPRQRTQCKGSVKIVKKWKLHINSRRWISHSPWRGSTSENIQLQQGSSRTRKRLRSFSRRIRLTLFSTTSSSNSTRDDAEAKNVFWTIIREFSYRHHLESSVKLYVS